MDFKISKVGIDLIKSFEGCRLTAYLCPASVWTIGWGTTGSVDGVKIGAGMKITQAKADSLLINNLKSYENAVNKLNINFNQNQFDALVSFCYNLGTGIFTGNLLTSIKKQDWNDVARQILLYDKARVNGNLTVLAGLARRRRAERDLFLIPVKNTTSPINVYAQAVDKLAKNGVMASPEYWKNITQANINVEFVKKLIENFANKL